MEQVDLLGAGVQLWNKNVIACRSGQPGAPVRPGTSMAQTPTGSGGSTKAPGASTGAADEHADDILVAYCSSLAVFVYDVRARNVRSLLAGYEGMISSLAWSLYEMNLLATGSENGRMVLWDIFTEQRVASAMVRQAPICMAWFPVKNKAHTAGLTMGERMIAVATMRGSVILWNATTSSHRILVQRDVPPRLSVGETREWKDAHRPTVLRCNLHPVSGEIAVGFKDGRVELVSVHRDAQAPVEFFYEKGRGVGKTSVPKAALRTGRVVDLQWDPFSPNYLLAAYADCDEIVLWDCLEKTPRVVQQFPLTDSRTRGVAGLAWQSWAPGNFISVSEKGAGLIHVWNVSQKTPQDTARISNGSAGVALCTWGSLCFVGLENGAMVSFDAQRRVELLTTRPSHRETVFDVRFRPSGAAIGAATAETDEDREFATCSFDGRVIVYGARDMDCRRTLKHKDKPIIYGISWSPPPRKWIASCTYTGILSVWDVAPHNAQLLSSAKLHRAPTYRVDWNKRAPHLIATSSADRFAIITEVNLDNGSLKVRHRLEHPAKTFGCAWNPFYSDEEPWLATGCGNGVVYIWDVNAAKVCYKLTKHDAKIFNVTWSPLRRGVLASGSDDRTIMIWRLPSGPEVLPGKGAPVVEPLVRLHGHTMNVRALLWSTEIPALLLSGSWDGSIRVWDTDKAACLAAIYDHHADVYGLDLDPQRPFTVLSSSRDTTIRVWELAKPVALVQAKLELICELIFEGALPTRGQQAAEHTLRGDVGRQLLQRIRYATTANHDMDVDNKIDLLRGVFVFFGEQAGMHDLFKLLARNLEGTRVVHAASRILIHHDEQLPSDDDARALALIKSGRLRSACEVLRRAGRWERALALAPAVSLAYWQSLAGEYGRVLAQAHDTEAPAFLVASGQIDEAMQFHKDRQEFDAAMIIAQAGVERSMHGSRELSDESAKVRSETETHADPHAPQRARRRRDDLAREQCHMYLESGRPLLAACAMLAVDDSYAAIHALMLAGIPELALCVAHVCAPHQRHEDIIKAVAAKCERYGSTELALQLYRKTANPSREAHLLCARVNFPKPVRQGLGLRQPGQYLQQAEELLERREKGRKIDIDQVLEILCASGDPVAQARAVNIGTEEVFQLLKRSAWDIQRMRGILRILQCVDLEAALSPEHARDRDLLLALSCFVGALEAEWRKFDPVVLPLYRALRANLREHPDLEFPLHIESIVAREVEFRARQAAASRWWKKGDELFAAAETLIAKTLQQHKEQPKTREHVQGRLALSRAADYLKSVKARRAQQDANLAHDGSMSSVDLYARGFPNGNTRSGRRSMFDNNIIRGPCVRVPGGDGQFYISLPHALMWDEVNAFSPLNNGARLFPSRYHVAQSAPFTNALSPKAVPAPAPSKTTKKENADKPAAADEAEPETKKTVRVH